mmetsp:Transcript_5957/g.14753  ORF Transcript_5957/g.14753 Transcript_5957/m.14753 type:complete len:124 (+) Transcript_5957:768-1139(+)
MSEQDDTCTPGRKIQGDKIELYVSVNSRDTTLFDQNVLWDETVAGRDKAKQDKDETHLPGDYARIQACREPPRRTVVPFQHVQPYHLQEREHQPDHSTSYRCCISNVPIWSCPHAPVAINANL